MFIIKVCFSCKRIVFLVFCWSIIIDHIPPTWSTMATDVIATEEVSNQRDSSDMNANKSNPESDTPNRTFETQENRNISSPTSLSSSSAHSGEELPEDSTTGNSLANGNSAIRTGDPPQEAATPDNRQKQGVRTSTPVRPLHTHSPVEHNGR